MMNKIHWIKIINVIPNFIKLCKFKKKHKYFTDEEAVFKRKSDNTLWIASHDGLYKGITTMLIGETHYFFRRCKPFGSGYIIDWNQIWEHFDSAAFDLYDNRQARQ